MKKPVFCTYGPGNALFFAKKWLQTWGYSVRPELDGQVTHLLLPVPTPEGGIPESLDAELTVMGGKLPKLSCPAVDFLQDPYYLKENAAITAACAVELAQKYGPLNGKKVLVIGWGRIGKSLAERMPLLGAKAEVATRSAESRWKLESLGFAALEPKGIQKEDYDIIFNTAPAPVLDVTGYRGLAIDLASQRGLLGEPVLWARGLPGKMAPEASGNLIAKTALRLALNKEDFV